MSETIASGTAAPIPILYSIAALAAETDAWFMDIWGVLHNGVEPFAPAVAACERYRAGGGAVVLVSNSPRPAGSVAEQLDRIGVARAAWDVIVSSGDVARGMIAAYAGRPIFHIGPDRDLPIFAGLDVTRADVEAAEAVVCTGLYDDERETPEDYADLLGRLRARRLPMICANPDLMVERGGRLIYCAGAVAAAYEGLGGRVHYAGKPHLPIYVEAFAAADEAVGRAVPRSRILAIGDGVRTDIAGAAGAGVRAVFIASGVDVADAAKLDDALLARLFAGSDARPIAAMPALVW